MNIKFAIVTASDTRDITLDSAGAALESLISEQGWSVASHVVVKDERADLTRAIITACDEVDADIVLTCGGTGLSMRDVTPEATMAVCEKLAPGIPEAMRAASMRITPKACLSRAAAGIRGRSLIINLPGSPKGACENLEAVLEPLAHGLYILRGGKE